MFFVRSELKSFDKKCSSFFMISPDTLVYGEYSTGCLFYQNKKKPRGTKSRGIMKRVTL